MFTSKASFFVVFFIKFGYSYSSLLVTTSLGRVQGHYRISATNTKYEAYEGIPYALPPVKANRFRPPVPVEPWKDIIIANRTKENCCGSLPSSISPIRFVGVEDCLYLNIYVPEKRSSKPLPVIVFFYGGAYQFSSLQGDEQNNFMGKNVIFVTFNHRHGILGFLSTEDSVVSGNMGLKDQAIALKWIKDHIKPFGGDPNRITLIGASSGGASIHYHYLSSMSKGLFNNGISLSGTALMPWAQAKNSRAKAFKLGELVNCNLSDAYKMVECLRSRSEKSLMEAQANFMGWRETDFTPFGPVVEKNTENPFIDRRPIDIINSGDVQNLTWITGIVKEEGLYPTAEFFLKKEIMAELDTNWESIVPKLLQYHHTIPHSEQLSVSLKVREFYFGKKPINSENLNPLIRMVGDRLFGVDSVKAAKLQARTAKTTVYYYHFSYRAAVSVSDFFSGTTENFGVSHGDDIQLIFRQFKNSKRERNDLAMQRSLIDLWVSTAHYGYPKFKYDWLKLCSHSTDFEYLEISGPDNFIMKNNNTLASNRLWSSIDFNEYSS